MKNLILKGIGDFMRCPRCRLPTKPRVIKTKNLPNGEIRRYRKCPECGTITTTVERIIKNETKNKKD